MPMEPGGPEKLRVYHLAQDLGTAVDAVLCGYVRHDSLADQLSRAANSVILNIAEGAAHHSPGRKVFHYQTAHGSAAECIEALTRLHRRHPSPALRSARRIANMVCIMLTSLIHAQEKRRRPSARPAVRLPPSVSRPTRRP